MGDNVKISKWAVGIFVSIFAAIAIQIGVMIFWGGRVSERLDNLNSTVNSVKSDLTRRIERLEDRRGF